MAASRPSVGAWPPHKKFALTSVKAVGDKTWLIKELLRAMPPTLTGPVSGLKGPEVWAAVEVVANHVKVAGVGVGVSIKERANGWLAHNPKLG